MFKRSIVALAAIMLVQGCCTSKIRISPIPPSPAPHQNTDIRRFSPQQLDDDYKAIVKEAYVYAQLMSNAYGDSAYYKIPGLKPLGRYQDKCTGFSCDVYEVTNEDKKRLIVAFRGTDQAVKDQAYANLSLGWEGQYKQATKVIFMVRQNYPGVPITACGHSLGGGLALHASLKNPDVEAFAFLTSPRVFANKSYKANNSRRIIIQEAGEALRAAPDSTLRQFSNKIYEFNFLKGNALSQHGSYAFSRAMTAEAAKLGVKAAQESMEMNGLKQ